MEEKNSRLFYGAILFVVFLSLVILLAPYINNNIYARASFVENNGEGIGNEANPRAETPGAFAEVQNQGGQPITKIQRAYRTVSKTLESVPGMKIKLLDEFFRDQVQGETTDEEIKEFKRPKPKEIYKFHGDKGLSNGHADDTVRKIMENSISFTWKDLGKPEVVTLLCASRGIYLQPTDGTRFGALKGYVAKEQVDTVFKQWMDDILSGKLNVSWSESGLQTIYLPDKQYRPKSIHMIFKGFYLDQKEGGTVDPAIQASFNEIAKELNLNYEIGPGGNLIMTQEEFERIKDKYGHADENSIGDYLINQDWEFVDDEKIKEETYDTSDGFIDVDEVEEKQGPKWLEEGLKAFQVILQGKYGFQETQQEPAIDLDLLQDTFSPEERNLKYFNVDRISPYAAYVLAVEKPQDREADEEGKAPYKYNAGVTPGGLIEPYNKEKHTDGLQVAFWSVVEGLEGYKYITQGYKESRPLYYKSDIAFFNLDSPDSLVNQVITDSKTWKKSWLAFMKYLDEKKTLKKSSKQKDIYIKYKNGKPSETDVSTVPFDYNIRDYFDAYPDYVMTYPQIPEYNPMFVSVQGGDGEGNSDPGAQKDIQLKRDEAVWQVGPYQLEYFKHQMEELKSPLSSKHNVDGKGPWFADVVNANLKGRYRTFPDNGGDDNAEDLLNYDALSNVPQNGTFNKKQLREFIHNLNELTEGLNQIQDLMARNGKRIGFNSVSDTVTNIIKKITSGKEVTGNDLLELEKNIDLLEDEAKEIDGDRRAAEELIGKIKDAYKKLSGKAAEANLGIDKSHENKLNEKIPERGNGRNKRGGLSILETFEFIDRAYMTRKERDENFWDHIYSSAETREYYENGIRYYRDRGLTEQDFRNDKAAYYKYFEDCLYEFKKAYIVVVNTINAGNELRKYELKEFDDALNELKRSVSRIDNFLDRILNYREIKERRYPRYRFANNEVTDRRDDALNWPNIPYSDILDYDTGMLRDAIDFYSERYHEENYNKEAHEKFENDMQKKLDQGIYGDELQSNAKEYEEGQMFNPKGDYDPSKVEIPHEKRKDTSKKTDRFKEYGDEKEEYDFDTDIIEDNDTSELAPEHVENSLESLLDVYGGLVGSVIISPDSKAEALFPLSTGQLSTDVSDKRGGKTNRLLYAGIYGDLGMLIKDNEAMAADGADHKTIEELKAVSPYVLSDQITPDMPGLVPGAFGRVQGPANLAKKFRDIARAGASLKIPGFNAGKYMFDARETALSTRLWGSSKEYRSGTSVEQTRRGVGLGLQAEQSKDIAEAIEVTEKEIERVEKKIKRTEALIRSLEAEVSGGCYQRDSDDRADCERRKAEARRELADARETLKALQDRLKALQDFLRGLVGYSSAYHSTYPSVFGLADKNNKIRYANRIINSTLKKKYNEFNRTISKLNKIDKHNEDVRIAKEKEEELKKISELRFAILDQKIKEMNYKVVDGKNSNLKTEAPANNNGNEEQNGEEAGTGSEIKDVKEWKFLIFGEDGQAIPEGEQEYPNPGQKFYYIIKHDPKLMEITSASFDFAYMTTNSRITYITSSSIQLTELQAKSEEAAEDPMQLIGDKVGYDLDQTFTPAIKAKTKKLHNQVLALGKSAIWINFKRIEIVPGKLQPKTPEEKGEGEEIDVPGMITRNDDGKTKGPEPEPEPDKGKVMGRLYIPIAGRTWIDKKSGTKHLSYNHKYDEGEAENLEGVFKVDVRRVAVKTESDGDQITIKEVLWKQKARLFEPSTFKKIDGDKIYTNGEGKWGPYNLHDICFSEKEYKDFESQGLSKQDVAIVFEVVYSYDGLKYTSVLPLQKEGFYGELKIDPEQLEKDYKNDPNSFKDSSHAYENVYIRNEFNRKFAEMEGGQPFDFDGGTTMDGDHANSVDKGGARTKSIQLEYDRKGPEFGEIYGTSKLKWYKAEEIFNDNGFMKERAMNSSTLNINLPIPIHKNIHIPAESLGQLEGTTPDGKTTEQTKDGKYVEVPWYNSGNVKYYSVEPYMKNINFGVKERETVRLFASKDLLNASLFVNNKAMNYLFNQGFSDSRTGSDSLNVTDIADHEEKVSVLDKDRLSEEVESANANDYTLNIYMADYLYRTAMYSTKMQEPADMGAMNPNNDLIKTAFGNYQNYADEIYNQMKKDMNQQFRSGGDSEEAGGLEDTRQLDIFLTYKVTVGNMSDMDDVVLTEIRDQYNPAFMQEVKTDMIKYIQESPTEAHKSYGNPTAKGILIPKTRLRKSSVFDTTQMTEGENGSPDAINGSTDPNSDKEIWGGDETIGAPSAKKAYINKNNEQGIRLEPLTKIDVYTVYRLRRNGNGMANMGIDIPNSTVAIDTLNGSDESIGNIVEIGSFASFDRGTNILSARVDEFSAPGTVPDLDFTREILRTSDLCDWNKTYIEADTGYAPGLRMEVFNEDNSRRLDGVVWEDSRNESIDVKLTEQSSNNPNDKAKMYVGNGIKDAEEKVLPNQKVILEERIPVRISSLGNEQGIGEKINAKLDDKLTEDQEYLDVPFIWPDEVNVGGNKTINIREILGLNSVQKVGDDGKYKFRGIPAGNFVVKFPYTSQAPGTDADNPPAITKSDLVATSDQEIRTIKWINGIDFKSTFYRNFRDKSFDENLANLNETWLPKERPGEKDLSYIRDDEYRRAEIMKTVRSLNHDDHTAIEALDTMNPSDYDIGLVHNYGRMIATTPKMAFSIENLEALNSQIIPETSLGEMAKTFSGVRYLKGEGGSQNTVANYPLYYSVEDVNAGLIQRPISKMELRKDITNISLETNSGKRLIDLNFDLELKNAVNDERKNKSGGRDIYEPYLGAIEMTSKLNNEKSEGQENVMVLNTLYGTRFSTESTEHDIANPSRISQGFIYINIDEQLLQGSNLKAEYAIRIVNLSEPDIYDKETERILDEIPEDAKLFNQKIKSYYAGPISIEESKKLNHEDNVSRYGFGHILKDNYYKPRSQTELTLAEIDKLKIQEVMDVIDNNCEYDERAFSGRPEAEMAKWKKAIKQDLVNKLAGARYKDTEVDTGKKLAEKAKSIDLRDEKGVPYIDDKRSNIYLSTKEPKELSPLALYVSTGSEDINDKINENCIDKWYIGTRKYISSMAEEKDLSFENTAELLTYTVNSGKRLRGIRPGSIFTKEDENANLTNARNQLQGFNSSKMFAKTIFEKDSFTTERISLTPPTGIKLEDKNKIMKIIIASVSLIGLSAVMLYTRKQYVSKHKKIS